MRSSRRRRLLYLSVAPIALLPAAGKTLGQTPPLITTGGSLIGLETIANSTGQPIAVDYAPDGTDRLFIAARTTGQVRLFKNNALAATSFLNLATGGVTLSSGGEKGLLGMAFHPNFSATVGTPGRGKFYTYTSEAKGPAVDFTHPELVPGNLGDHDSVFREWTVDLASPDTVNYAVPSRELLRLRQPQANHNGGAIRFDTSGRLYIALGDGGGETDHDFGSNNADPDDGHSSSGNGQDTSNVYGKILRINPLDPDAGGPLKYSVPASNPFVGVAGVDEIFAYGLRNPFQMHFDSGTGTLYAGDVGQAQREEIDIIVSGGNYGWVNMEGTRNHVAPAITDINPIGEYTHSDGVAVIGGTVYRGSNIPELTGKYVFGELDGPGATLGRLLSMDAAGGTITEFTYAINATHAIAGPPSTLHSFGVGSDGELYATFANGNIARILGRQWMAPTGGSWNTTSNWLLANLEAVPNATGATANFLGRLINTGSAPATVNLDGNKTVGFLRFNNVVTNGVDPNSWIIASGSGGTLTINNGASSALVQVIRGTHTIAAPLTFASHTDLDVAAGAKLNLTGAVTVNGGPLTVTKKGGGTVVVSGALTFLSGIAANGITITDGEFAFAPGGTARRMGALAITGGRLNLFDNRMIGGGLAGTWNGSAYTGVSGLVDSGRGNNSNAHWDGSGIVTTDARAVNNNDLTSIGAIDASDKFPGGESATSLFAGQTVTGADTLVMFTWGGDANLDGKINIDDYGQIDFNVGSSGSVFGWYNGDFNYDGKINIDDYGIIDFNVTAQTGTFSTAIAATPRVAGGLEGIAAVPEPASIALMSIAAATLLGRRRRVCR
ncbi:MAG: PQQ-dependent sugar dehydrogenase [Tepidisphaeraceae bacterium]